MTQLPLPPLLGLRLTRLLCAVVLRQQLFVAVPSVVVVGDGCGGGGDDGGC